MHLIGRKPFALYNEIDPFAAAWLRELIKAGHIAPGEVDTRSIADVMPSDLAGFTQCHFFAGIGVWSYALRQAGWSDDRPVWTGSCPCQPFSSAGKGQGFKDERHLWPEFYRLISQCRPTVCFGEQVASKDGLAWLDLVQADMEDAYYAFGAVDTCSASFGAPHIRQRLYWVGADTLGDSSSKGLEGCWGLGQEPVPQRREGTEGYNPKASGTFGLAYTEHQGRDNRGMSYCRGNNNRDRGITTQKCDGELGRIRTDSCADCNSSVRLEQPCADNRLAHADNAGRQLLAHAEPAGICRKTPTDGEQMQQLGSNSPSACGLAHAESPRFEAPPKECGKQPAEWKTDALATHCWNDQRRSACPTNGYWRDADLLLCRDGKWRAVEPGTFPLAHGSAARVGRLRGYGNAINAEQAKEFIEAFMEVN